MIPQKTLESNYQTGRGAPFGRNPRVQMFHHQNDIRDKQTEAETDQRLSRQGRPQIPNPQIDRRGQKQGNSRDGDKGRVDFEFSRACALLPLLLEGEDPLGHILEALDPAHDDPEPLGEVVLRDNLLHAVLLRIEVENERRSRLRAILFHVWQRNAAVREDFIGVLGIYLRE